MELQQGSHARLRDLEMMKQKPTLEQRFLQISQVPSLSKSIQQATPSHTPPPHPHPNVQPFHARTQFLIQTEVKFETR